VVSCNDLLPCPQEKNPVVAIINIIIMTLIFLAWARDRALWSRGILYSDA
jgi:hypothetical protein